jgi:hypothetical protein
MTRRYSAPPFALPVVDILAANIKRTTPMGSREHVYKEWLGGV